MIDKNKLPLLAEMVDSYNVIHKDYLKTDSIIEFEHLQRKMRAIEKDILVNGVCINLSTEAWQEFLFELADIKSLGEFGIKLIRESLLFITDKSNYNLLDKIFALEDEILLRHGKHSTMKDFYSKREIMQQINEKTVVKQVIFRDYLFIADQAINLMKENIKAI
jgi:hypothetical protein